MRISKTNWLTFFRTILSRGCDGLAKTTWHAERASSPGRGACLTKQLVHSLGVLKQFRRALPRLHNIGLDMKADLQNLADQLAGRRVSRLSKLLALDVGLIGFF